MINNEICKNVDQKLALLGVAVTCHDDVIKWKHFPRYWPFVRGIHRSPVNSPHKGQWRGALMFSLIYVWIDGWVNNHEAGDLRRYRDHYDVTVMLFKHVVALACQCALEKAYAWLCTFLFQSDVLWDMRQVHCGIRGIVQLINVHQDLCVSQLSLYIK